MLGLTRFLRRTRTSLGKERLRRRRRRGARHDPASVWFGRSADWKTTSRKRWIGLRSRLSALRDHLLRRRGERFRVPLVRRLIADHPHVPARLLIGNDAISDKPEAEQCLQGLACGGLRSDRHGGQQCPDAPRLHRAPARGLAGGHRPRQLAAGRLPSGRILGGTRMRLPQHLSGALAICRRGVRLRLCPGQVDALPAQPDRGRRRHSVAGSRTGGGCRHHQAHARRRPTHSPRRCAVRATLGIPAATEVWARQLRWARLRQASFKRYYALEGLAGGFGPMLAAAFVFGALEWPVGGVVALGGDVVWRRGRACVHGRMAPVRALPARLDASGHAVADGLDRRLARPRFRVARQSDARG